jgi:hypothetical protein
MTSDDLIKLIMAGTGSVAAIYTVTHPPDSLLGRTIGADASSLTSPYYEGPQTSTLMLFGLLALGAILLLKK